MSDNRGRHAGDNDEPGEGEDGGEDPQTRWIRHAPLVANDPAAGETVEPGPGEGNNGPTGGTERELEPELFEHDEEQQHPERELDLDDEADASGEGSGGMGGRG